MALNGNGNGSRIEAVTESVSVRLLARASMIVTPVLVTAIGWGFVEIWNAQKELNKDIADGLQKLNERVITIEVERRVEAEQQRRQERRNYRTHDIPRSALPPPED